MLRRKRSRTPRPDYKEVKQVGADVAGWPAFDVLTRAPHLIWGVVTAPFRLLSRLFWNGFDVSP